MEESQGENKGKIKTYFENMKNNPWQVTSFVFILVSVILLVLVLKPGITGNSVSELTAGQKAVDFLNNYVISGGGITLDSVKENNGVYTVTVNYNEKKPSVLISLDADYIDFGQGMINMDKVVKELKSDTTNTNTQETAEVPKSDKPIVELFVMSYCPYGTQAEKGILPVVALLGYKIDFKVRFVHYILHGDKEDLENKRQLCIREEEGQDKLNKYLVCILDSDNVQAPADVSACEKTAGIDSAKLKTCLSNKAEDYYAADSALSQGYGVQGSPTLIINGVESSAGRSPASYLQGICAAFNTAPAECSETLSSSSPSAGFGYNEGTDTVAKC